MTPQEMINVIQAHVDGKQLQWCAIDSNRAWEDCKDIPTFAFNVCDYRVKPVTLRPHWPAIKRDPMRRYMVSTELFPEDCVPPGYIRLATEYPPVMLP